MACGVSMDSALATAGIRTERLLAALGESAGPVVTEQDISPESLATMAA